jgi:hypothetical protein
MVEPYAASLIDRERALAAPPRPPLLGLQRIGIAEQGARDRRHMLTKRIARDSVHSCNAFSFKLARHAQPASRKRKRN